MRTITFFFLCMLISRIRWVFWSVLQRAVRVYALNCALCVRLPRTWQSTVTQGAVCCLQPSAELPSGRHVQKWWPVPACVPFQLWVSPGFQAGRCRSELSQPVFGKLACWSGMLGRSAGSTMGLLLLSKQLHRIFAASSVIVHGRGNKWKQWLGVELE